LARRSNPAKAVWSPLDAGPIAPLTPHDLLSLLKGAFAFAIFTFLFLFGGVLLHFVPRIRWPALNEMSAVRATALA
jgi:hypothetical protein